MIQILRILIEYASIISNILLSYFVLRCGAMRRDIVRLIRCLHRHPYTAKMVRFCIWPLFILDDDGHLWPAGAGDHVSTILSPSPDCCRRLHGSGDLRNTSVLLDPSCIRSAPSYGQFRQSGGLCLSTVCRIAIRTQPPAQQA